MVRSIDQHVKPETLKQHYIEAYREDATQLAPDLGLIEKRLKGFTHMCEYIRRLHTKAAYEHLVAKHANGSQPYSTAC